MDTRKAMEQKGKSRIVGLGIYLPPQRVTSDELMEEINSQRFGIPTDYISKHIGIKERRVAATDVMPSDMAIEASISALKEANINATEIDAIIYCGISRDWVEPATAHRVQHQLGAINAICLDVTNACLGFMNGIALADMMIGSGSVETVLVCTGEKSSTVMNEAMRKIRASDDKKSVKNWLGALTVGDAGAAMLLQRRVDHRGWQYLHFASSGKHYDLCCYQQTPQGGYGRMVMGKLNVLTKQLHTAIINCTYKKLNWTPQQVDSLYCHQVGAITIKLKSELTAIPLDKIPITYEYFGNLASASIPANMVLNRLCRDSKYLVSVAGSGMSICQAGYLS